jgi:membrane protease YdiL (CAAX protease family)
MILYIAIYSLFFCFLLLTKEKRANRLFDSKGITNNPVLLIVFHLAGILILGFAPLLSGHEYSYFIVQNNSILPISVTIALTCICIIISYRLATKKFNQLSEEGSILLPLHTLQLIIYFIVRIAFICCYEIWFRALLLDYGIRNFGLLPSVLVNVALYTLLHIVNDKKEMASCVPFGFLLCFLSLWQGSALPAITIHLALTVTYELKFLRKIKTLQSALV